ncbi:12931_t:CDS:2, partial [Funneliformis geosporum]
MKSLQALFINLPFWHNEEYDIRLAIEILGGLRENVIPGTPEDYVKIYTECWDNEPDNRPSMNQIFDKLNAIIKITEDNQTNNYESKLQQNSLDNADVSSSINNSYQINYQMDNNLSNKSEICHHFDQMKAEDNQTNNYESNLQQNNLDNNDVSS